MHEPDVDLAVGSRGHAEQTAGIMVALEKLFLEERPSVVVVYGDVDSAAAALVVAKLIIPLAHVEVGMRSFTGRCPRRSTRVVTDRLSDLLLVSADAIAHLAHEGRFTTRA